MNLARVTPARQRAAVRGPRRTLPRAATVAVSAVALATLGLGAAAPAATAAPVPVASSSSEFIDPLGRPTPAAQRAVADFAAQPWVPQQVRDALEAALEFAAGTGEPGGPDLPAAAPRFHQGFWPTVSRNCMGPGLNSTGTLIAVPGPASIPAPAPAAGHVTFVFTALGTEPAAAEQGGMSVYWVNLNSGRTGVTPLENNEINPAGPATVSGAADTGAGRVLAAVSGAVQAGGRSCTFAPTAVSATVR